MNNSTNKRKKKKLPIFLILLVLVLVGLLIFWMFRSFTDSTVYFSVNQLNDRIDLAQLSADDKIYFSSVTFDEQYNKMSVVYHFVENGKDRVSRFSVSLTQKQLDSYSTMDWSLATSFRGISGNIQTNTIKPPNTFVQFLFAFGPVLLLATLFFFVYRSQMKGGGGGIFAPGRNQAQKIKSNKTFKDVAGNKESIEEVKELVDYLKNPKKYQAAGSRIPKGILLGGPPGTGKTLLAKATAGEANVPFYFVSASSFVEMFVGVGAKRVREMFKEARQTAPAIIFIDELDAVGRSRGAGMGGGNDEREQTLNQLLVEMDGITENAGILVIAATNRPDVLDPALLRPGRFDRTITVSLPDIKEREEILRLHAVGKRMSKDIKFKQVAKRTPGYSGAQLENVINEASLLSVRENTGVITLEQIDEAIDRVMAGPAKKNRVISKEELTMIAYHEAGHAVVGIKSPGGNKVQKITIIPRGETGGYNLMLPETEKYNKSKSELIAMIKSFMGGRASEQIIYGVGEVSTGASDDIAKATSIARRMVTEWGMSELGPIKYEEPEGSPFLGRDYNKKSFSDVLGHEIDIEVRKLILAAEKEAIKIVKANLDLLELIKDLLLEQETIVAEEIEYIAKHMKHPPKKDNKDTLEKDDDFDLDTLISSVDVEDDSVDNTKTKKIGSSSKIVKKKLEHKTKKIVTKSLKTKTEVSDIKNTDKKKD